MAVKKFAASRAVKVLVQSFPLPALSKAQSSPKAAFSVSTSLRAREM